MAKAVKVGDAWPSGKIQVMIPTSFTTTQTLQTPRITATLYKPVPVNTILTLSATANVSCYSIETFVTPYNGVTTSLGGSYGGTSATCSYQFMQTGLYTIKVSAVKDAGGTPVNYYYTIRIY